MSWAIQHTRNPPNGRGACAAPAVMSCADYLTGVSCVSARTCTAVGWYPFGEAPGAGGSGPHRTLAERWNGTNWAVQATPTPRVAGGGDLIGVSCVSARACTAVGSTNAGSFAERWNGRSWAIQVTPTPAGAGGVGSVSCVKAGACTAVGSYTTAPDVNSMTFAERWNATS
jgi:hypothetical protein